ncbi:hypothetical protein [Anaerocolumna sp. MB42-C2]|uniref:glycoside hydrolase family 130 protein n=1 Tax=Anaerocolumna sp. MB42-C2 TaxID=3070997 RepID=UPI0027DEDD91|nr:hypothetical protein [Anaerocolumna sp. MB42-C2]WMJ89727.1 hypothetical protein RBU59_09395 [Anaerocolumna sp. MB42-C2]
MFWAIGTDMIKFEKTGIVMKPLKDQLGCYARFNPGIYYKDGIIHMLYRATNSDIKDGQNYISSIGYARLDTNNNILYDSNKKVIFPTLPYEVKGCEDPRIVEFENNIYIFYTAYDGIKARVAIARTEDFDRYEKLGVIEHFGYDKDAFILPERIDGKIAYIHRISPNIQLDYFNSFDELLSKDSWIGYEDRINASIIMKRKYNWENQKIGGSTPPLKTDKGWLLLYHGVDDEKVYRCSAALLDLKNPANVIARLPYPLLEPTKEYEISGDVSNVVFPEGAYILDGQLNLYYGAADKYIASAKININELLAELMKYPVS